MFSRHRICHQQNRTDVRHGMCSQPHVNLARGELQTSAGFVASSSTVQLLPSIHPVKTERPRPNTEARRDQTSLLHKPGSCCRRLISCHLLPIEFSFLFFCTRRAPRDNPVCCSWYPCTLTHSMDVAAWLFAVQTGWQSPIGSAIYGCSSIRA